MADFPSDAEMKRPAKPGSMYEAEIESSGIVDSIRCNGSGETEYCELKVEGQSADVVDGSFDTVHIRGTGYATFTPGHDYYDKHLDSAFWRCADIESTDTMRDTTTRELVCIET